MILVENMILSLILGQQRLIFDTFWLVQFLVSDIAPNFQIEMEKFKKQTILASDQCCTYVPTSISMSDLKFKS